MSCVIQHSILMVSYNQELYIEQALQSVLDQTESPYEVILVDDSSTDNTWVVVEKMLPKFDGRLRAIRNECNLGLSNNLAKLKKLFTGNVISLCAGDDYFNPRTVELVNEGFRSLESDPALTKMLVVTNSQILWPDGHLTLWNNYIERNQGLIKTRLRGSLSYRGVGLSQALYLGVRNEAEIRNDLPGAGLLADFVKGFEEVTSVEKVLYVDYTAAVYRYGVGITSITDRKVIAQQKLAALNYVANYYNNLFDHSDRRYIKLITMQEYIYRDGLSFLRLLSYTYLLILNIGNFGYNNPIFKSLGCILPGSIFSKVKYITQRVLHK